MKNQLNSPQIIKSLAFTLVWMFFVSLQSTSAIIPASDNLKFDRYTTDQGLSHSKVNCILQDRQGFLWFGTNEGLNRFDGYNFSVYQKEPQKGNDLSANLIRCIIEDKNGMIWIGTEAGGVNICNLYMNQFQYLKADSTSLLRISHNDVNWIIEDHEGIIWLGTGYGINRVDWDRKLIEQYPLYPDSTDPLVNQVSCILEDHNHQLWVATFGGGMAKFDRATHTFIFYVNDPNDPTTISDNDVRTIFEDSNGQLWVGTYNGGLNKFDWNTGRFHAIYFDREIVETRTVRTILEDNGELWVGTRKGLYRYNPTTGAYRRYTYNPRDEYSLSQNNIMSIFRDRNSDIWIGTWGGLNYLNRVKSKFVHIREDASSPTHLNHATVYAVMEDRKGDLWFGTEEGGVNRLNRSTGLFTYYMYDHDNPYSLSGNNIKAFQEDHDGRIWIGIYQGGVDVLNPVTGKAIRYMHDPNNPNSLSDDDVYSLLIDSGGIVWIGTRGGGLNRYDRSAHSFSQFDFAGESAFQNVYALYEDTHKNIWIGANDGHIGRLDKSRSQFKIYALPIEMSGIEVRSIFEDQNGDIYFGTIGGGLCFLNVTTDSILVYSQQDGLPSNIIHAILEDDHNNLWISSSNGLSKFSTTSHKIKTYYHENGLQSNQFCYNACCKTRAGELIFGGINGATLFQPDDIHDNMYIPPLVFTDFKLFNKSMRPGDNSGLLTNHINETNELFLTYKQSVYSFEFSALNYYISQQNQYAYMMEGFDSDWNYVGPQRIATYTNLDPGDYVFRVKAANNDGYWNTIGKSIVIHIAPPIVQTFWFRALASAVISLIIYYIINGQIQKRKALKATALANLNQLKLLRSQMNPHFLFNALGSIRSMILIDKDRAWQMVSELSDFFRYSLQTFNKIETELHGEIEAAHNYLHIEKIRFRDSLTVAFDVMDSARQCMVPVYTLQPLIENAIKHGMQTSPLPLQIIIHISLQGSELSINIANTGQLTENSNGKQFDSQAHGTAIENIKKRLELMFGKEFSFKLYEDAGWVHSSMKINYAHYTGELKLAVQPLGV
ncbi:histidine kinase [candidate division KSB1 bacterium]|nr:histidine kinase [candidate division KSB1 bacterium]